jgi:hypothetical protein
MKNLLYRKYVKLVLPNAPLAAPPARLAAQRITRRITRRVTRRGGAQELLPLIEGCAEDARQAASRRLAAAFARPAAASR